MVYSVVWKLWKTVDVKRYPIWKLLRGSRRELRGNILFVAFSPRRRFINRFVVVMYFLLFSRRSVQRNRYTTPVRRGYLLGCLFLSPLLASRSLGFRCLPFVLTFKLEIATLAMLFFDEILSTRRKRLWVRVKRSACGHRRVMPARGFFEAIMWSSRNVGPGRFFYHFEMYRRWRTFVVNLPPRHEHLE